jgi:hypothetical protein
MSLFSPRLPHVLSSADLARSLIDTYVEAMGVDDEEAFDRLERALERPEVLSELYRVLSAALATRSGAQTAPDSLIDKLRKGVQKRRGRVKAAPDHPAIAAVLVWINLELGIAPETMREPLRTEKGRRLLEDGLARLGAHLVGELLK